MTPLAIESIQDKLFRLKENTKFIEDILVGSDGLRIKPTDTHYYGLEHMLQLSIQAILDIGTHILAEEFNKNPKSYAQVIVELGEVGVITPEFAGLNNEMAKFRNKLVHNYDTISKEMVITYGQAAPEIFRAFGKAFTEFIQKKDNK